MEEKEEMSEWKRCSLYVAVGMVMYVRGGLFLRVSHHGTPLQIR